MREVVLSGGTAGLAERLGAALGVPHAHVGAEALRARIAPEWRASVWVHLVPAAEAGDDLAEARLLGDAIELALAAAGGAALTFVAVLPMPGAFVAPGCDVAAAVLQARMQTELETWSRGGRRIVGLVHGGLEGHAPPGQRPLEDLRRRIPMRKLGTVAQLADALRYVASSHAGYLTGVTLAVDGGAAAYSWVYPTRTI